MKVVRVREALVSLRKVLFCSRLYAVVFMKPLRSPHVSNVTLVRLRVLLTLFSRRNMPVNCTCVRVLLLLADETSVRIRYFSVNRRVLLKPLRHRPMATVKLLILVIPVGPLVAWQKLWVVM